MNVLATGSNSKGVFWFFAAPRVLGSSLQPGAQGRLLNDRTSSPSLTTFSCEAQLRSWRGQSPSSSTRRALRGRVWFGGSKCHLKDIKATFQNHDDRSLGEGSRQKMESPFMIRVTLNKLVHFPEVQSSSIQMGK